MGKSPIEWTGGARVRVGESVGNNSSANFNVYFFSGPYAEATLNCHPQADGFEVFR